MNWGYKILGVYLLFVAGIIYLVVRSSSEKIDLVTKDYYEQELVYQEKIEQSARAAALSAGISVETTGSHLRVSFPEEMKGRQITASVLLYCPSDSRKDIRREFITGEAFVLMEYPETYQGLFELQVDWKADGKNYYSLKKHFIQ